MEMKCERKREREREREKERETTLSIGFAHVPLGDFFFCAERTVTT
jgi:hypothetical protein